MTEMLLPVALASLAAVALLAAVAALVSCARLRRELAGRDQANAELEMRTARLEQEFKELRRGSQGMVKLVRELRSEVSALGEKQQQFEFHDPEARLYNRAVKLLEQGAGLDEIMETCELPRAEAELLMRLHGR